MKKLRDLIQKRLHQHHLGASADSAEVLHQSNLILGNLFKAERDIKAYCFTDGILFIGTNNAVWSQEVWSSRSFILDELTRFFGLSKVKDIRIKSLTTL